ncbi:MAG TPA: right-handed parallel beta-helix repeat-containing protein [Kofleriaceae bacterium]|nr:right-handed parallel beta-helix repeat-containing protein [Kofleriaceae bacterium]
MDTLTRPVCDTSTPGGGVCVQCMAGRTEQCTGLFPRCDLTTETCAACIDDNDCGGAAGVCLPDGSCASPDSVIHAVSTGGLADMTSCGGLGAGNSCDLPTALAKARTESGIQGSKKNVIKLDDIGPYTTFSNFVVDVDSKFGLVIDAGQASLEHNGDGSLVTINAGKGVTIIGGTIQGAHGTGGDGIRCNASATLTLLGTKLLMNDESGIDATGCTITVVAAEIRGNTKTGIIVNDGSIEISRSQLSSNLGGGITVGDPGKFVIVGNVFLGNGDPAGVVGGLSVATTATGNQLEFNTLAENRSMAGLAAGVSCFGTFTAQNNIVWDNNGPSAIQVSGNCLHAFSDIGPPPITGSSLDGGNNLDSDPLFLMPTADLRLNAATPVRGKANPDADLTRIASKDLAGAVRIKPADLGAYVAPPP